MKLKSTIPYLTIISSVFALLIGIIVLLEISLHHLTLKFCLFFGFSSAIFAFNYLLLKYCDTCSEKVKTWLTYSGITIVLVSIIIWFGLLKGGTQWHTLLGVGIIYALVIQVQLLGWSATKPGLLAKSTIFIALIVYLFLAFVFIFKVALLSLYPLVLAASAISVALLFYGLYVFQPSKR